MRKQLWYHLNNTAALTTLVGDKIYPQRVPTSDATPFISFVVSDREAHYQQDGYNDFENLVFEVSSVGTSVAQCSGIADAVFTALKLVNTLIGAPGDQQEVSACYLLSESDDFFLNDGSQDGIREITQTYQINYME